MVWHALFENLLTSRKLNICIAGETWRVMRKAAVHMLRPENVDLFKPYQRAEAAQLLWEMCHKPEVSDKIFPSFSIIIIYIPPRIFMTTSTDL